MAENNTARSTARRLASCRAPLPASVAGSSAVGEGSSAPSLGFEGTPLLSAPPLGMASYGSVTVESPLDSGGALGLDDNGYGMKLSPVDGPDPDPWSEQAGNSTLGHETVVVLADVAVTEMTSVVSSELHGTDGEGIQGMTSPVGGVYSETSPPKTSLGAGAEGAGQGGRGLRVGGTPVGVRSGMSGSPG